MSNRTIRTEPRNRPEMVSPGGAERWRQFFQHFVYFFEGLSDCYKVRHSYGKDPTIIGTSGGRILRSSLLLASWKCFSGSITNCGKPQGGPYTATLQGSSQGFAKIVEPPRNRPENAIQHVRSN